MTARDDPRGVWAPAATPLSVAALAGVAAAAAFFDAPATPLSVGVGVAGSRLLEGGLSLRPDAVRRAWARRSVRAVAVVLVVAGGPALAAVAGGWVLTALSAGLCTYLVVLAVASLHRS